MVSILNNDSVRFPFKNGFHIAMLDVNKDLISDVRKLAKASNNWSEIFNRFVKGKKPVGDKKRFQASIKHLEDNIIMKTFLSSVEDNVRVYDPNWIVSNGVFLHSYRGGKKTVLTFGL